MSEPRPESGTAREARRASTNRRVEEWLRDPDRYDLREALQVPVVEGEEVEDATDGD